MKRLAFALLAACAGFLAAPTAPARAAGYEGQVVTVIVPHGPSGPMNQYARMIAPYLAKHLKAKDVRIDNQPGAGTLKGTNLLWNADPDGLTIAFTSIATPILAMLADSPGVRFDAAKFVYLGRVSYEPRQLYVGGHVEDQFGRGHREARPPVRVSRAGHGRGFLHHVHAVGRAGLPDEDRHRL